MSGSVRTNEHGSSLLSLLFLKKPGNPKLLCGDSSLTESGGNCKTPKDEVKLSIEDTGRFTVGSWLLSLGRHLEGELFAERIQMGVPGGETVGDLIRSAARLRKAVFCARQCVMACERCKPEKRQTGWASIIGGLPPHAKRIVPRHVRCHLRSLDCL